MTTLVNGLHSACACHREGWSTVSWKASDAAQGSAEAEPVLPVTCLGKVAIKMSSAPISSFVLVLLICSCPWGGALQTNFLTGSANLRAGKMKRCGMMEEIIICGSCSLSSSSGRKLKIRTRMRRRLSGGGAADAQSGAAQADDGAGHDRRVQPHGHERRRTRAFRGGGRPPTGWTPRRSAPWR